MRRLAIVLVCLLAVFTFINAYSMDQAVTQGEATAVIQIR